MALDISTQTAVIRTTLLSGQANSPNKTYSANPDITSAAKNEIIFLTSILLEKRQASIAAAEKKNYYDNVIPATRDAQLSQSVIVIPDKKLGQADTGGNPFGAQNDEPNVALPVNITDKVYPQNAKDEDAKKKWGQWKKDLKPFIGNTRNSNFPGPNDLPHVVDDSVAGRTKYNIQTKPIGKEGKEIIYKSWAPSNSSYTGTPDEPISTKVNEMLKRTPPGSYKFFIEKLQGRGSNGPFKKGQVKKGLTAADLPNRMVFPAYIAECNDSYDVQWSEYKFIGRGEPVSIYQQTVRTITISFWVLSDFSSGLLVNAAKELEDEQKLQGGGGLSQLGFGGISPSTDLSSSVNLPKKVSLDDLTSLGQNITAKIEQDLDARDQVNDLLKNGQPDWGVGAYPLFSQTTKGRTGAVPNQFTGTPELLYERSTFLAQCNYGWYRRDGKLKEQPFIRIRVADYFDLVCRVNSTQVTMDEFEVDLNPSVIGNIPMGFKCTMQLQVVHEDEPSSEYRKFYHRVDRDNAKVPVEAGERENKESGDSFIDSWDTGSPLKVKGLSNDKNKLKFPSATKEHLQNLKGTGGGNGLNALAGGNAFDKKNFTSKENLKRAVKAGALLNVLKTKVNNGLIKDLFKKKSKDQPSTSNSPQSNQNVKPTKDFGGNEPQKLFPKFKDNFNN